jgi:type IV pilus assembly protein PilW
MSPRLLSQQGFLLVQQMVVLLLSALLLLMFSSALVLQWQAFRQQSQLTLLQQTAVQLHALLQRELSNSQFWAGLQHSQLLPSTVQVSGDCQSAAPDSGSFPAHARQWLPFFAGTVGSALTPVCLTNAIKQSDFIQLKHLAGDPLMLADLRNNRAYLKQNGWRGRFVSNNDTGLDPASWYWPYVHELYYVAGQTLAGAGIPVLMRKRLIRNAQGQFVIDTHAVLDGVELLVIEMGLDADGDGYAEQFLPASQLTAAQWRLPNLISQVRYFVLLRSLLAEPGYRNQQQFQLGQRRFQAPGDPYRRLLISSSVSFP